MKKLIEKIGSRKLVSTLAAYGLGIYMIKSGHVTEGVALIGAAQGSYNLGQGMADAKSQAKAVLLEAAVERLAEPVRP